MRLRLGSSCGKKNYAALAPQNLFYYLLGSLANIFYMLTILIALPLKKKSHQIFDLWFFHKSIVPRPLSNTLKYFRILFRIRGDIREYMLCYIARSHDSPPCCIARSHDSPLCNIALSRLRAMQHMLQSLHWLH
jgi:hypothetical protein